MWWVDTLPGLFSLLSPSYANKTLFPLYGREYALLMIAWFKKAAAVHADPGMHLVRFLLDGNSKWPSVDSSRTPAALSECGIRGIMHIELSERQMGAFPPGTTQEDIYAAECVVDVAGGVTAGAAQAVKSVPDTADLEIMADGHEHVLYTRYKDMPFLCNLHAARLMHEVVQRDHLFVNTAPVFGLLPSMPDTALVACVNDKVAEELLKLSPECAGITTVAKITAVGSGDAPAVAVYPAHDMDPEAVLAMLQKTKAKLFFIGCADVMPLRSTLHMAVCKSEHTFVVDASKHYGDNVPE